MTSFFVINLYKEINKRYYLIEIQFNDMANETHTLKFNGVSYVLAPMWDNVQNKCINASTGAINVNKVYDFTLSCVQQGSNLPSASQYGSLLTLPYRKPTGNSTPDFGTQILIPNGDDSKPHLYFRTSHSAAWDAWKTVLDSSNYTGYTYPKSDVYTKTETDNKIAALVDSAPDKLNTLNELAAALGNDKNFSTTVTNLIAGKADKTHSHSKSEITDFAHTHTVSDITDLAHPDYTLRASSTVGKFYLQKNGTDHSNITINLPSLSGGAAATSNEYVSGVTVSGHTVTVTKGTLPTIPTIPTIPDSLKNPHSLTIQKNGTTVTNGVYDGSAAKTVNITVPTKVSELTNDLGFKTTDNNTTYSAGTGLSLSGTTFNHSNSVTAVTTAGLYKIKYDAQGHITGTTAVSNNVTGSGTNGYIAKWNGTNTITNGPAFGSSTTTFLRNDGTWATPSSSAPSNMVTTDTDQTVTGVKTFKNGIRIGVTDSDADDGKARISFTDGSLAYIEECLNGDGDADCIKINGGNGIFLETDGDIELNSGCLRTGGLVPSIHNTYDIGTTNTRYKNGYFSYKLYAAGGLYESSDERLKNFGDKIPVDLDKLSTLKKHYFTWKEDNDKTRQLGVSAQEIQSLYPEIVTETEDGILNVAYDKLSVIALAAVDEVHKENLELKSRIEKLEELVNKLIG